MADKIDKDEPVTVSLRFPSATAALLWLEGQRIVNREDFGGKDLFLADALDIRRGAAPGSFVLDTLTGRGGFDQSLRTLTGL
ncbi:hypothetical protein ACFC1T_09190 [Kitasatospora sp. NPDC056076]|uniref:hypothetical protein n=1 Tax=Kitasatospora sp. NPDC056076 TaxID=3345703 RepID=UPI0035DDEAA2